MNNPSVTSKLSRRRFLATTGAAVLLPTVLPGCALGRGSKPAASNRITLGVVGWGMQGPGNTRQFLALDDCQVVAACDLDKNHLNNAVETINSHYGNKDCKAYSDYRELLSRGDIDAVMLAVPDHWHALVAVEAAGRKKDIYGEKPLARTIAEQQAIVKAVQANGRIWQTGSWQRSVANFHKAAEIVRNGLIGTVTHVNVGLPQGHTDFAKTRDRMTPTAPPPELDYETWIGPSKMEPYICGRVHMNWRWNYNIGGGQLLDWVGHHCDIAHWALDLDRSGPLEIEGHGDFPPADAVWNTCTKYRVELKYPGNLTMTIAGGWPDIKMGTKWIGTEGWVYVNRGEFQGSNPDWSEYKELPEEMRRIKLYRSRNHQRNFLDCVKSRQPTITPVETAHHSTIPGHLGLISMLTGRKLNWDSSKEVIVEDAEASKLLTRSYRLPWKFESIAQL
ncbi:MAG TPA: Gfo/Idh/MocA family oxidoreductase [Verrucomicrobiae bacterium]|nr:Gfo/Idh/MocA family oxidoreductase [Verrucomicrobiae bacterium]